MVNFRFGFFSFLDVWDIVRVDVGLKFMVVAVIAYGIASFDGSMLSLKIVCAIAHFTDWIVAHVHVGALGWNGFMTFAIMYWLFPRLYGKPLYSLKLANFHFWIGTLGIIFYNLFSNRVDQLTHSMDEAGFSIIQEFQTSGK